jgi:hypothetical protein
LWSIHPKYLDTKGLLAVWREGLLAKKVIEKKTQAYGNHPQLIRFKNSYNPKSAINAYLFQIYLEAKKRGYAFSLGKIRKTKLVRKIPVTSGQIKFEFNHLLKKLRKRDIKRYRILKRVKKIDPNPIFRITYGGIESWEKHVGT